MTRSLHLPDWLKGLFRGRLSKAEQAERREFVYLDEVSVYSLLASHKVGVVDTFTETAAASLTSDIGASIGAAGVGVNASGRSSQTQSSQVVRKATVQSHFKELYDIERPRLAVGGLAPGELPTATEVADVKTMVGDSAHRGSVISTSALSRGELIEVNVELNSDPLFRLSTLINTVRKLVDENETLFAESGSTQLDEMRAVAQVLESLLEGLVPVRGRMVDYQFASIAEQDVLIHTSLLDNMSGHAKPLTGPVYVAGVAQHSYFWKDIRRTLLASPRYTTLCRVAAPGLSTRWRPTTTVDLLGALAPEFEERMSEFTSQAEEIMRASGVSIEAPSPVDARGESVLRSYIQIVATCRATTFPSDVVEEVLSDAPTDETWLNTVDGRRRVFEAATSRLNEHLDVELSPNERYDARHAAVEAAHPESSGNRQEITPEELESQDPSVQETERFLETEIVAIYW